MYSRQAGVQAFKWFEITVKGRDTHAGTTPFYNRKDSMLCAARLIVHSNAMAKKHGGLSTTGILTQQPGSINTMAHTVTFTLDIRHTEDDKLSGIEKECRSEFERIARKAVLSIGRNWSTALQSSSIKTASAVSKQVQLRFVKVWK